jgi:hypothetical protein
MKRKLPRHRKISGRASAIVVVSAMSAIAFVCATLGTSLLGDTAFYGGENLLQTSPWDVDERMQPNIDNNIVGDTLDFFIPGRSQMAQRARSGDWPAWNPLQGAGSALGSTPLYGLLAPTGWPWWILPENIAPAYEKLAILVMSALGTALFLRRILVSSPAAWVAGLIYAGSGFMIAWTNWPQAGVAALLPWLLWSIERALQDKTLLSHVPVALSVAFLLLGGFPAVAGLGFYMGGAYIVIRLAFGRPRRRQFFKNASRQLIYMTGAGALGCMLAAAQLLPFFYAFRDLDLSHREAYFEGVQPLQMLATSIFPNVWGTRSDGVFFTTTNPIESNAYIGGAAVLLVLVALLMPRVPSAPRGVTGFFASVLALGILLIYVQGPALAWVGQLPVFANNPPGRIIAVVLLAAAILAGIGLDALLRQVQPLQTRIRYRLALAMLGAVVGAALIAVWAWARTTAVAASAGSDQVRNVLLSSFGVVTLSAAIVMLAVLRPRTRSWAVATLPIIITGQALAAASPMWSAVPARDFYPRTPVHDFLLQRQGHDRIAVTANSMFNGSTAYYGLRSASGHVFSTAEYVALQRVVCEPCALSSTYWVLPGPTDVALWRATALDRMAVRYIVTDVAADVPGRRVPLESEGAAAPRRLMPDLPSSLALPAGRLRGFQLQLSATSTASGELLIQVKDEKDRLLLASSRSVTSVDAGRSITLPVAGEDLSPNGSFTLNLLWRGDYPLALQANASSTSAITVIRPDKDGLRLVYTNGAAVWQRLTAAPRVRWASSADVVATAEERLRVISEQALPGDSVVLSEWAGPVDGRPAAVEVQEDSGDRITVDVAATGRGYLTVADALQHDWTATVNGVATELVAADHAFVAVYLPAGDHHVVLEYRPRGAVEGVTASAMSLGALVSAIVVGRVRSGRKGEPSRV